MMGVQQKPQRSLFHYGINIEKRTREGRTGRGTPFIFNVLNDLVF